MKKSTTYLILTYILIFIGFTSLYFGIEGGRYLFLVALIFSGNTLAEMFDDVKVEVEK